MSKQIIEETAIEKPFKPEANNHRSRGKAGTTRKKGNKQYKPKGGADGNPMTSHKYNDVSWYAKNDQMLKDSASLAFGIPLGLQIPHSYEYYNRTSDSTQGKIVYSSQSKAIPGVLAYEILLSPGITTAANSPVNLAANNIYAYVRYANSGAKNYDQADLMLYLLAMDSLYAMWNWLKRIYGYARMYDQQNRYLPIALGHADGVDILEIQANLADFRLFLNRTAAQITSFCVPAVMPLFLRHSWMFSNIYKDSSAAKAQLHMFTPMGFYQYRETDSSYGGSLRLLLAGNHPEKSYENVRELKSMSALMATLEAMIQNVAYSEDVGIMSGDILKAYGQARLFKLTPVTEDYTVTPVYNEEVLSQMHNSNIIPIGTLYGGSSSGVQWAMDLDITQDPDRGFLEWYPTKPRDDYSGDGTSQRIYPTRHMLNSRFDTPTPGDVMIMTRLTGSYKFITNPADKIELQITQVGTEIVTLRRIITLDPNSERNSTLAITIYGNALEHSASEGAINQETTHVLEALITQFDWHPIMPTFVTHQEQSGYVCAFTGFVGDVNNYVFVEDLTLQKLHLTAIMSEFNIPQLASF